MNIKKETLIACGAGAVGLLSVVAQLVERGKYKALKKEVKTAKEISQINRALERSKEKHDAIIKMAGEVYKKHGKAMPEEIKDLCNDSAFQKEQNQINKKIVSAIKGRYKDTGKEMPEEMKDLIKEVQSK